MSFLPGAQGSEEILDGVAKDDSGASVAMDLVKLVLTLLVRVPVESVRPFMASLRVLIPFPAIFENVREPSRTSVARLKRWWFNIDKLSALDPSRSIPIPMPASRKRNLLQAREIEPCRQPKMLRANPAACPENKVEATDKVAWVRRRAQISSASRDPTRHPIQVSRDAQPTTTHPLGSQLPRQLVSLDRRYRSVNMSVCRQAARPLAQSLRASEATTTTLPMRPFTTSSSSSIDVYKVIRERPKGEIDPADLDPNTAVAPWAEKDLWKAGTPPIGSRRRRFAIRTTQNIPFEQLPYQAFQEARKILAADREEKLAAISAEVEKMRKIRETDASVYKGGEKKKAIKLESLRRHVEELKILADINDPSVKRRFEDGLGTRAPYTLFRGDTQLTRATQAT
jgi:hypothetical protein